MCGRFTLTWRDGNSLAAELGVPGDFFAQWTPRYNIAPTQTHFFVTAEYERRKAESARWGLRMPDAHDARDGVKTINVRADTVDVRPRIRDVFRTGRCVIPADGFFEWTGPKKDRRPIWFHREDGGLLLLAGLYSSWQPKPGETENTFTIVTTGANQLMSKYHNRMPAIISDRDADEWIDPKHPQPRTLKRLLAPADEQLLIIRFVSPKLNSPDFDSLDLLQPDVPPLL